MQKMLGPKITSVLFSYLMIIGQAISFKLNNIRIISVGLSLSYEIRIKKFFIKKGFKFSYKNFHRLLCDKNN